MHQNCADVFVHQTWIHKSFLDGYITVGRTLHEGNPSRILHQSFNRNTNNLNVSINQALSAGPIVIIQYKCSLDLILTLQERQSVDKSKVHWRAAQQQPDVTKPNQVCVPFLASKMQQQHLSCRNSVNHHFCSVSQLGDPASFAVSLRGCLIHGNSRNNFQGDKNLNVLKGLMHLQRIWRHLKSLQKDQGIQINQNAAEN